MEFQNKILIVDDEIVYLNKIVDIIVSSGQPYELFRALDGKTALTIAQKELPDLIITDWDMPYMDGIVLIKELKQNPDTRHIPVIMCTGVMTTAENLNTAMSAGAIDYIRKPIDEIELQVRIKSMLLLVNSFNDIRQKEQLLHEQEKKLMQSNIDQKAKELTTQALNMAQNEETVQSVIEDLKEIFKTANNKKIEKTVQKVIRTLTSNSSAQNWEEFRKRFEEVHTDFFNNMLKKYPDLTQNEKRLCALLRLNLVTKDISSITGQSIRSIEIARYRLRKKFDLSTEASLYNYLAEF